MWSQYGGSCGGEKLCRTDCSVDLYSFNSDSLHCPVTVYSRLYLQQHTLLNTAGALYGMLVQETKLIEAKSRNNMYFIEYTVKKYRVQSTQ